MKVSKKKPIQIYIEHEQNNVLEVLSKKRGLSKAAIIRESVEKYLKELPIEEDPAINLIGLGTSSKEDLAEKHDKYLAQHIGLNKKWHL